MNKICRVCGKEFETIYSRQIYCCRKCNHKYWRYGGINVQSAKRIREYDREYTRNYYKLKKKDPKFKKSRSEYFKRWYRKNKSRQYDNVYRYLYNNKDRMYANKWVNAFRVDILNIIGRECSECNSRQDLHVHHLKYFRLGWNPNKWNEKDIKYIKENLVPLCRECHLAKHNKKLII